MHVSMLSPPGPAHAPDVDNGGESEGEAEHPRDHA